jgi:hypothetical protein
MMVRTEKFNRRVGFLCVPLSSIGVGVSAARGLFGG